MVDGLSFVDKCRVNGVAPLDSGMCVETAGGPNGAVELVGWPTLRAVPVSVGQGAGRPTRYGVTYSRER